jgi:short-subunit dehydrogenase
MRSADRTLIWRHVAITGASSGIGAALARRLAAPGRRLSLAGRDMTRLEAVAQNCSSRGAETHASPLDVTNRSAVAAWLQDAAGKLPLDLVICNAGILDEAGRGPQQVVEVNLLGTMNTMGPAIDLMRASGGGRIAVTTSLAAFRPQPKAPAYAASKAAVRIYAEGMRAALHATGIELSVVCPGIVATPMLEGHQVPVRFLVSADRAAEIIVDGLARGRAQVYFPWLLYTKARLMAFLPTDWPTDRLRHRAVSHLGLTQVIGYLKTIHKRGASVYRSRNY